ncbi:MAG: PEP-CTERM sorting domain-containing protein [Methylophilaceae bacterium]
MKKNLTTLVKTSLPVALLALSSLAHAENPVLTFSEDNVLTGAHKYTLNLAPGEYSISLKDDSQTFSYLGVTVGQGATNLGKLVLNDTSDFGLFNFIVPQGVDATYSAIVFGKTVGAGDFTLVVTSIPEPAIYSMLFAGLGLLVYRRRKTISLTS